MWRRVASLSPWVSSSKSISLSQAAYQLNIWKSFTTEADTSVKNGTSLKEKTLFITFVLGGPGSGKSTQCVKIANTYGFTHLSVVDLLRREIMSNGEHLLMFLNTLKDGNAIPSEVTVELIKREMESGDKYKFLIDGFPRSKENCEVFECVIGAEPNIVLFFDCPEEEMEKRVLKRRQGLGDRNSDLIRKRIKAYAASNVPVLDYYLKKGKLYKINAVGTVDEIFEQVHPVFTACEAIKES